MSGFVAHSRDKGFFPTPVAAASPPPAHPEGRGSSLACEEQLPADEKHRCFPESLSFPCLSAKRQQPSRPLPASSRTDFFSRFSTWAASEFPALPWNCCPELSAGCKYEQKRRILPNLLRPRGAANTAATCPACGLCSEKPFSSLHPDQVMFSSLLLSV